MTLISGRRIGTPDRNGLPERRNYTAYRGTGKDELTGNLTDEDLAPYAVDYKQWLPSFERGNKSGGAR